MERQASSMVTRSLDRPGGEPRRSTGFNLAEIMLAMLILGLALAPVFGLITGGMVRTDVSASYENAATIAASVLGTLISTTVAFSDLEAQAPSSLGQEHPGPKDPPNVLGTFGSGTDQYFVVGRIRYFTDLWVGFYPAKAGDSQEITLAYYLNPQVYFEGDLDYVSKFYRSPALTDRNYSPYNKDIPDANLMADPADGRKHKWAADEKVASAADLGRTPGQRHLAKLILRIRWGGEDFKGAEGVRGGEKAIWLTTLKARLE
jgi:hypothetical protein